MSAIQRDEIRKGDVVRYRAWGAIQTGSILAADQRDRVLVQDHHQNGAREWIARRDLVSVCR